MLKKFALMLAVVTALIVILAAIRPDTYRIERSLSMKATPAAIYSQIADLHKWELWSPWTKLDPNARITYRGPDRGTGASMGWDGNMEIGRGTMTITQAEQNASITLKLQFEEPLRGEADSTFTLTPEKDGTTKVVWSMSGKNNFLSKLISLFIDCEAMIGEQYDKGLANLKQLVRG